MGICARAFDLLILAKDQNLHRSLNMVICLHKVFNFVCKTPKPKEWQVAEKCGYGRSLMDRLQRLQHGCRHLLNIQYRMHPAISAFPNAQFYDGAVKDGPNVLSADYGRSLYALLQHGAYAFLDCMHGFEVSEKRSWTNPMEVQLVTNLVKVLAYGS